MVKANLKEKLEKIEKGELKPREYPNREKLASDESDKFTLRNRPNDMILELPDGGKAIISKEKVRKILEKPTPPSPKPLTPEEKEGLKILLGKTYESMKGIIKFYIDLPNEQTTLIALWIIGTYFYKEFETYPYLFFNAMKGSGKTRMLKLITALANDGKLLASLTEAVMFRSKGTIGIDEFENLGSKEKQSLRELLNASYKKGIKIQRMKKTKTIMGEEQVIEEFEPYKPIVMANIWGVEEVLSDRCITLVLDKSSNLNHIKLIEDFAENQVIRTLKEQMKAVLCSCVVSGAKGGLYGRWNLYVKSHYTTQDTLTPLTTHTTLTTQDLEEEEFFRKVDETGIDGRQLELFFSLFMIAQYIGKPILNEIVEIAKGISKGRKIEELTESKDITLIDFVSRQDDSWYVLKQLTSIFRTFTHEEEGEEPWINPKWVGRALKRLNLVKEKRRIGEGIQVILDIEKAKKKMEMFR